MMNLVIGLVVMMVFGVAYAIYAARRAPVGYEDETGFHYGPETVEPAHDLEGVVPVPAR